MANVIRRWRSKVKEFGIRERCRSRLAALKGIVLLRDKRRETPGSPAVNPTTPTHLIGSGVTPTTPEEPEGHYHVVVAKVLPDPYRNEPAAGPSATRPPDQPGDDPDSDDSDSSFTRDIYIQVDRGGGFKVRRLAKMDTGADVNIMAKDVQEATGYKLQPYSGLIRPFESEPIRPLGRVENVEWRFRGHPKTYVEDFFVLDTGLFDTLIGKECIRRHRLLTLNLSGRDA